MILDFVKRLFQLKLDHPSAVVDAYFIGHSKQGVLPQNITTVSTRAEKSDF